MEGVSRLLVENLDEELLIIVVYDDEEFKPYLGLSRDIVGDDGKLTCLIWWRSAIEEDMSRREELASFDPAREGVCSIVAAVGCNFGTRFLGVDEIARRALDGGISLISGNNGGPCCDWEANGGRPPYTSFCLLPRGVAITCTL